MKRRHVTYTIAAAVIAVVAVLALARLWWPAVIASVAAAFGAGYARSWQA